MLDPGLLGAAYAAFLVGLMNTLILRATLSAPAGQGSQVLFPAVPRSVSYTADAWVILGNGQIKVRTLPVRG